MAHPTKRILRGLDSGAPYVAHNGRMWRLERTAARAVIARSFGEVWVERAVEGDELAVYADCDAVNYLGGAAPMETEP